YSTFFRSALAQPSRAAPYASRAVPGAGHQRHRLPGDGLHAVSGAEPGGGVLGCRAGRRLRLRHLPAALAAQRSAATLADTAGLGRALAEAAPGAARAHSHTLAARRIRAVLHRRLAAGVVQG